MRRTACVVIAAMLLGALVVAVTPGEAAAQGSGAGAGRIAVKLAPGIRLAENADGSLTVVRDWDSLASAAVLPGLSLRASGRIEGIGVSVLEPVQIGGSWQADRIGLDAMVRALQLMPGVLWAEVAVPLQMCLVPDDPWYAPHPGSVGQWGMTRVGLPEAWDITTGDPDVTVAVIDTGLNRDISDFAGRIVHPYSVIERSAAWPAWQDDEGHGSAVAGVAVARGNDGAGIAGTAWNVGVMPVKISVDGYSDSVTLAQGVEYAVDSGADVINISFATSPGLGAGATLREAIAYALDHGVVVVAAAGNDGASSISYPAALPGVIAVGATDSADARWSDSEGGSNTGSALDLVAPGVEILSYYPRSANTYTDDYIGTSLSSPLVAGVAALMLSVNPALTPQEVAEILGQVAEDLGSAGWDRDYGSGLVDAGAAVAKAAGVNPATTTTTGTPMSTTTTVITPTTSTTSTTSSTTTTSIGPRFSDVSEGSTPYWHEIEYLASLGIVTGSGTGLFHPEDGLTRQQFAKVIVLTLGLSVSEADTSPFTDVAHVPGDFYPYHFVAAAYNAGITRGTTPTNFSPYRVLSRAQLITMVTRATQLPEPPAGFKAPFPNFSATHFPYARRAAYAGLLDRVVGIGPSYAFAAPATRGEVCALLYVLLQ
ncbi:MAG: hypothetical protein A2133_12240 [Actinobacteria bacterium RBG_16_64_13]|nr:MAG: hypothetical protein A2133_12240 [Actinobacteria bacterium RBG_16_64_13]